MKRYFSFSNDTFRRRLWSSARLAQASRRAFPRFGKNSRVRGSPAGCAERRQQRAGTSRELGAASHIKRAQWSRKEKRNSDFKQSGSHLFCAVNASRPLIPNA
jgi:hypothetical protein